MKTDCSYRLENTSVSVGSVSLDPTNQVHFRIGLCHVKIVHLYFVCVAKTFCVQMVQNDNNFNS